MDREACEFSKGCNNKCPSYKVACVSYCQKFTVQIVNKIGKVNVTVEDVRKAPLLKQGVYSMLSKQKLVSILIKRLQHKLTTVKVYHFSAAIEAGISDELPTEQIIVIDTTNKYKDPSKGLQVISGFAQKLGQSKLVLVKAESNTLGEEVTVL